MSIFNNFGTAGTVVKFKPVYADETLKNKFGVSKTVKTIRYCITFMKEYKTKSLEELRFEDYTLSRKGPHGQITGLFSAKIQPSFFGSFSSKSIPFTYNCASTSCGFGMTSHPGETGPFSEPGTGFCGATATSTFGLNDNTFSNIFSTDSPTKPLEIPLTSHTRNAETIPFATQLSFEGFGNTNTALGSFGIHQPEKTNNMFGVQQSANQNLFGANRVAPVFEEAELVSVGFETSPSPSLFGKLQQTPFAQSEISDNSGLIGSSTGFGVTAADATGTVIECSPVTGIDTMVKFGMNEMISTRHHCITCMQEYESKSLEELRLEDYAAGRKGKPNQETGLFGVPAQPSLFGIVAAETSVATPSFGSSSGGFGTTNELGGTSISNKPIAGFGAQTITTSGVPFNSMSSSNLFEANIQAKSFVAAAPAPLFSNTNTVPEAEAGFGMSQNTALGIFGTTQANQNIGLFNQNKCTFDSSALCFNTNNDVKVQQVTSKQEAASILAFSSSNEFGGFESTSTTNTTSVSGAKPSGIIDGGNTNCVASSTSIMFINTSTQTGADAEQLIVKDDKIQQLSNELDSLKLDLKHFKDELKSTPSKGRKRIIIQREKERDKLLQEEQQKNRRLMTEIENLRQQNNTLVNLNIELQKTMLNYTAKREGMLKYLLSENSISDSNGDNTREANDGGRNSKSIFDFSALDDINSIDCDHGGDTKESMDAKETPVIKKSLLVEQSPKLTIAVEDDYAGPRLEDEKVTFKFMEELVKYYKKQGKLHRNYARKILLDVKTVFESQPSLVDVEIPENGKFTIVGDIHGQFFDLLNIFEINGFPSETNPYLFNGDVVDRGSFSIECIFTLFGYKLLYPNHCFIARGNHESASMNEKYGFEDEVKSKYTPSMVSLFTQVFNWLPLAHCINSKVFVMHGGLFSKDDVTLDEIRRIDRNRQPPDMGIMCELLWSDPQSELGRGLSKRGGKRGLQFGPDVTKKFLEKNNLDYIVRSHEYKENGFDVCHDGKCITIFSAPNYCDTMGNQGAIMILNGKDMTSEFKSFEAVPHPIALPIISQPKRKSTAVFWIPCTELN